MLNILIN